MRPEDDEPRPLNQAARAICDAARASERLSLERRAALRRRVMAAAGVGAGALAASAAEAATGAGVAKAAGLSLFAKVGLSVGLFTAGFGALMMARAWQPPDPALVSAAPAIATAAPLSPESAIPSIAPPEEPAAPLEAPAIASPPPGAPRAARSAAPPQVDSLEAETKLLRAAQAELSAGNAAGALALLDEHAAKFPRGALSPERRAARAMALCNLGRTEEGRREAEALYGKDARNPLADKIDRACAR